MHAGPVSLQSARTTVPGWRAVWSLLLLWILVWILPDMVSVFVQSPTLKPIRGQFVAPDQATATVALDCTRIRSLTALAQCAGPATSQAGSRIFVPVSWPEIETQPGQWDWTLTDSAVAWLQHRDLIPVLVLYGTPDWVRQRGPVRDRDDPELPSSHSHAFATFAAKTAQRYQGQVRHFQLDIAANIARPPFPFAVSPVRYGQMVALAADQMAHIAPDPVLLSAPLLPVDTASLHAIPPTQWLTRFQESQGQDHLDIVQWRPRVVSGSPAGGKPVDAPILLTHNPFPLLHPDHTRWVYWWFTDPLYSASPFHEESYTTDLGTVYPGHWLTVAPETAPPASQESTRRFGFPDFPWTHGAGLALVLLIAASVWIQATAAFRWLAYTVQRQVQTLSPLLADALFLAVALGVLGVVLISPWWFLTSLVLVLLLGLALLRPDLVWLMLLAALPFDFIHANVMTPLQLHTLALSPAQILALILCPVACMSAVQPLLSRPLPRIHRPVAWAVVGTGAAWLLLVVLCHSYRPSATRWVQVLELEIFPLYVAGLSWWLWSRVRTRWLPLTALTAGIALFAALALLAWIVSPWTPGPLEQRLSGLTFSPNHAAMILLRGFWLALGLASFPFALRHLGRLHLALAAITGWALLLTFSRGALVLGMPASLLVWLWWQYRAGHTRFPQHRFLVPGILSGVAGILIGMAATRFNLWTRLLDPAPITARWVIWQHTWSLWLQHPWLGQGSDGFYWGAAANFPFSFWLNPEILHPHNVWLEILVRSGSVGLSGMLLLCVLLFRALCTTPRHSRVFWLVGAAGTALCGGLAHGQVDAFWSLPDIAAMNLLLVLVILQWTQKNRPGAYAPGLVRGNGKPAT